MKVCALGALSLIGIVGATPAADPEVRPIPIIYGTDLFHPHDDPDDHFDLATLFAISEFDVKAIILDLGDRQKLKPGRVPLTQMFNLTGRRVPYATGLSKKLNAPDEKGRDQPAGDQGAIELLIKTLKVAPRPMIVFTTGSVRDVCAAFNREPALLREKIGRLYVNIGNATEGTEWNVDLDQKAFVGLLRSGLPIYWCPCLPAGHQHSTEWAFHHNQVLPNAPQPLQNFFIYALQRVRPDEIDPITALNMNLQPWRHLVMGMHRRMWCTAPFLHAADRTVYATSGGYIPARTPPPDGKAVTLFEFVPARVDVKDNAHTRIKLDAPDPNVHVFRVTDLEKYTPAMTDCLRHLIAQFPLRAAARVDP